MQADPEDDLEKSSPSLQGDGRRPDGGSADKTHKKLPLSAQRSFVNATPHLELLEKLKKEEDWKARDLMLKAKIRKLKEEREKKRLEQQAADSSPMMKSQRKQELDKLKQDKEAQLKAREELKQRREKKLEDFMGKLNQGKEVRKIDSLKIKQTGKI